MSTLVNETTDSQSKRTPPGSWHRRHTTLATGLLFTVTNLFAGHATAGTPRGAAGENPWGHPVTPDGARKVFTYTGSVPATPEEIFGLLCPVLEYDWLDDWTCTMQYSESGVAEQGCAFQTRIQAGENWICSRYEPPTAIQYVVWLQVGWMTLDLSLEPQDDGTTALHWTRTFTATKPLGRKLIGKMTQDGIRREMEDTHGKLVAYLEGT